MIFNFTFAEPVKMTSFSCLVNEVDYDERTLIAIIDFDLEESHTGFEESTWSLSPVYKRHFHYLPLSKNRLVRLREFRLPQKVKSLNLNFAGWGPNKPDPNSIIANVYAITRTSPEEGSVAIYKGIQEQ